MSDVPLAILGDDEKFRTSDAAALLRKHQGALEDGREGAIAGLRAAGGPGARMADALERADWGLYEGELATLRAKGTRVATILDPHFPPSLASLSDCPLAIYVVGTLPAAPAAAVVGTREVSPEGMEATRRIVEVLARCGYGVVSGLALGTDACAHEAALRAGAPTFAVLPGGVRTIVPAGHAPLATRVARSGGLVAETTDLKPIHRGRFIQRNRLTSALSDVVIAIESRAEGGTTHQVRYALAQGRPVLALRPRAERRDLVEGFQAFVRQGATPLDAVEDLPRLLARRPSAPPRVAQARLDGF